MPLHLAPHTSARAWPLLTLGVGAAGGAAGTACHLPLGWLLGALVGAAALCCSCERARLPQPWRYAGQLAVGLSAGLAFTPSLLVHVAALLPLMTAAVLVSIVMALGCSRLLVAWGRTDPTTAYFASVPGGVAEMANLADQHGGEVASVAVAQTLRIFLAVLTVPLVVRALGRPEGFTALALAGPLAPAAFLLAIAAAAGAGRLLSSRRVPNAWLLGGLAIGLAMAILGGTYLKVPGPVLPVAQVLIGTSLGARLRRRTLFREARIAVVSVGATALLLTGNIAIGLVLARVAHFGFTSAVLSTSPGGLAEMGITAIELHADVGLVVAFHLVRTVLVATLSVPLFLGLRRLRARAMRGRSGGEPLA